MPESFEVQIIPICPSPFPPRKIKTRAFLLPLRRANEALCAYRNLLEKIPHPEKLLIHLRSLEAIASLSKHMAPISLAKFLTTPKKDPSMAQVRDYIRALIFSDKGVSPFSKKQICRIHKIAKKTTAPKNDLGCYRNRQNWIGVKGCTIEEAYFYPPAPEDVPQMMQQLFHYAKKNKKEPLLQIALVFAQLLIIHPFMDGNGRIARMWIPSFLHHKKLLPVPFFFMSHYFQKHRFRYFLALYNIREDQHWEEWILFFLKGFFHQAKMSSRTAVKIKNIYDLLVLEMPHLNQTGRLFLFERPIFTLSAFKKTKNAVSILEELRRKKWISRIKERKYRFVLLLKILRKLQK